MAVGFTWAHLIGDIPSAAACFSTWAQLLSGKKAPAPTLRDPHTKPPSAAPAGATAPPSVKATAAPVGDDWRVPTACEMVPFSFHVTEQQLKCLLCHESQLPLTDFSSLKVRFRDTVDEDSSEFLEQELAVAKADKFQIKLLSAARK